MISSQRIRVFAIILSAWVGNFSVLNVFAHDPVLPTTLSPDNRYGVSVPKFEDYEALANPFRDGPRNELIEMKGDKVVGVIRADVAFERMNDAEIVPPLWDVDDSTVLWRVDGKWGYNTEVLLRLDNGKTKWQVDVLDLLQQEILKRTRKAVPEKYATVKAGSKGYGSWFKDGFAIDCVLVDDAPSLKFPLLFRVFLTSNPKSVQSQVTVNSRMTAHVNRDGTTTVIDFHLGDDPPARDFILPSQLPK